MGLMLFSIAMFFAMIFATLNAIRAEDGSKRKPASRYILIK